MPGPHWSSDQMARAGDNQRSKLWWPKSGHRSGVALRSYAHLGQQSAAAAGRFATASDPDHLANLGIVWTIPPMANTAIVRIELTPTAKKLLEDFCHRTGKTRVSTMSRMTEWFSNQSESIQGAILRQYPKEIEADVVKLILKKLSAQERSRE